MKSGFYKLSVAEMLKVRGGEGGDVTPTSDGGFAGGILGESADALVSELGLTDESVEFSESIEQDDTLEFDIDQEPNEESEAKATSEPEPVASEFYSPEELENIDDFSSIDIEKVPAELRGLVERAQKKVNAEIERAKSIEKGGREAFEKAAQLRNGAPEKKQIPQPQKVNTPVDDLVAALRVQDPSSPSATALEYLSTQNMELKTQLGKLNRFVQTFEGDMAQQEINSACKEAGIPQSFWQSISDSIFIENSVANNSNATPPSIKEQVGKFAEELNSHVSGFLTIEKLSENKKLWGLLKSKIVEELKGKSAGKKVQDRGTVPGKKAPSIKEGLDKYFKDIGAEVLSELENK